MKKKDEVAENTTKPIAYDTLLYGVITPLEKQVDLVKEKHPKHLVWLKMNGFIQCMKEDAIITSGVLGCVLTERPDNGIKITGFPEKMFDKYLLKVIRAGYPVVMCEL